MHYARWKMGRSEGEVDVVMLDEQKFKPAWAVEMKWGNRYVEKPSELKGFIGVCHNSALSTALVTTLDKWHQITHDGIDISYFPASLYAYMIANHTLQKTNNSA